MSDVAKSETGSRFATL